MPAVARGRRIVAGLALAVLVATPAAGAVDKPGIAKAAAAAVGAWRQQMVKIGWVGLQGEVAGCYFDIDQHPTQAKAAYCIALDECTVLDTKAFPPDLIPVFFRDPAFGARRDGALAAAIRPAERQAFLAAVQTAIEPCARAARQTAAGLRR